LTVVGDYACRKGVIRNTAAKRRHSKHQYGNLTSGNQAFIHIFRTSLLREDDTVASENLLSALDRQYQRGHNLIAQI